MIRAIYRDGVIYPKDPVPQEWADGQEVQVDWEPSEPSDDPAEIDRWAAECRQAGVFQLEAGERERMQAALDEADADAKAYVRRQMELGE